MSVLRLSFAFLLSVLVFACDDSGVVRVCGDDSDCAPGFVCTEDGRCICTSDGACAATEVCNAVGQCQIRVGCETSFDCSGEQFCDRATGSCLDRERCTTDLQCELGYVCDAVRFECVPGCRDVGDCRLGAVCECESSESSCQLKQCKVGPCGDNSYCRYGESCIAEVEGAEKRCVKDERGPFCESCNIGPGQPYCWGEEANFCLVDTSKPSGSNSYFCGVECETSEECPWGFGCSDVLILTEQTCGGAAMCPLRNIDCSEDAQCPGGVCDQASGKCRARCVSNEGDQQGFCTCLADTDCPTDTCDSFSQRCTISQQPCDPNLENPCPTIYCKNEVDELTGNEIGYCHIGRNCAPVEGVSCDQVRGQR